MDVWLRYSIGTESVLGMFEVKARSHKITKNESIYKSWNTSFLVHFGHRLHYGVLHAVRDHSQQVTVRVRLRSGPKRQISKLINVNKKRCPSDAFYFRNLMMTFVSLWDVYNRCKSHVNLYPCSYI